MFLQDSEIDSKLPSIYPKTLVIASLELMIFDE